MYAAATLAQGEEVLLLSVLVTFNELLLSSSSSFFLLSSSSLPSSCYNLVPGVPAARDVIEVGQRVEVLPVDLFAGFLLHRPSQRPQALQIIVPTSTYTHTHTHTHTHTMGCTCT